MKGGGGSALKWIFRNRQTLEHQLESLRNDENLSKGELLQCSLVNAEVCRSFTSRVVGYSDIARRFGARAEYS